MVNELMKIYVTQIYQIAHQLDFLQSEYTDYIVRIGKKEELDDEEKRIGAALTKNIRTLISQAYNRLNALSKVGELDPAEVKQFNERAEKIFNAFLFNPEDVREITVELWRILLKNFASSPFLDISENAEVGLFGEEQ